MHTSLIQALGIVDCVILKRSHNNVFQIVQNNVSWFLDIFKLTKDDKSVTIAHQSLFLDDFLIDADEFWKMHSPGQVESGIWTEQSTDGEYYLEAIAASTDDAQYLVIKNVEQHFQQQQQTLQVARELLISNDEVVERHDYLNERLRSILLTGTNEGADLPLYDAIQFADIGVVIVDDKLVVQETNPAAYRIFETKAGKYGTEVFDLVIDLISRQFPEKEQLFHSHYPFSGELYWHQPPLLQKWLKTDIQPVKNEHGDIKNWIITISDVTRLKYLMQTNEELVLHDSLTGLPNRNYFWQELNRQVNTSRPFAIVSIDIVNFKNVNDLFGYLEGDDLLQQFTARVKSTLKSDIFMTRVGADEFMLLNSIDADSPEDAVEALEQESIELADSLVGLMSAPFFFKDKKRCELEINIGIAQFPKDAASGEDLLACVDIALNEAKTNYQSTVQLYNTDLKIASKRRLILEDALKKAIKEGKLELHLQPIFELDTQKIIKAEALLRWRFEGELVSPDEFIPIAENSGVINQLGRYVIAQACDILARFKANSIEMPVCINFSPKQIYDLQLIDFIRDTISAMDIKANLLELEVTEGVLVHNYEKVSEFLRDIKLTGLSVSVDDFGTGYSSLSYLKHLPIDTLKIDRSFISELAENEDDQAIVGAILAIATQLKLDVIAEGVETGPQREYLLDNSCRKAQGFIFSKAVSVDEFIDLFEQNEVKH